VETILKQALIPAIEGQGGSCLAELLLTRSREALGFIRRASSSNTQRIDHPYQDVRESGLRLILRYGDSADFTPLTNLLCDIRPDEVYNLAAGNKIRVTFDVGEYVGNVPGLGATSIHESIRRSGSRPRFYMASSSEMFSAARPPESGTSRFRPRSPCAAAIANACWLTVKHRHSYGMFACKDILFNHECPPGGDTFIPRNNAGGAARPKAGQWHALFPSNLNARRQHGFAPDWVEATKKLVQKEAPHDDVLGSGGTHLVRQSVERESD
jgi:GDPmannose 4,6-dehydratase